MKIFLIRHGETIQNTKESYEMDIPDHKIYLTDNGIEQAKETAQFLKKYIEENNIDLKKSTLFLSPYERTRQTAKIINEELNIEDVKEDITLIEQNYGLFSNTSIEECKKKYPEQFELYDSFYQNDGKFYAKLPQGESPYDVALRVKQFIDTLFRDFDKGIENVFIVTHGNVIKSFILDWFHYSPEWFNKTQNPKNCSVVLIEQDKKAIYIKGGEFI